MEIIGGAIGGAALLAVAAYYRFVSGDIEKSLVFCVAGVMGPGLWLDTHICYWNGKMQFKQLFWFSVPLRLLQLFGTVLVLLFSTSSVFVFAVQTGIMVVANIGSVSALLLSRDVNKEYSSSYGQYGYFSSWLYLLGNVAAYLDKVIIALFFGLETLAVFAIGELLYSYLYKIPYGVLGQVFQPRLAEQSVCDAARWVRQRQPYIIASLVGCCAVGFVLVPVVYPVLFSVKYTGSIKYAQLFLVAVIAGAFTLFGGTLVKAHGMKKQTRDSWMLLTILPLVLMPCLILVFGVVGVVYTRIATNAVLGAYYTIMLRRLAVA